MLSTAFKRNATAVGKLHSAALSPMITKTVSHLFSSSTDSLKHKSIVPNVLVTKHENIHDHTPDHIGDHHGDDGHDHHHHDHTHHSSDDSDEMEQEDMFVDAHHSFGHAKVEWGGPRRGGRFEEPTRFGDWERKGRCTDF